MTAKLVEPSYKYAQSFVESVAEDPAQIMGFLKWYLKNINESDRVKYLRDHINNFLVFLQLKQYESVINDEIVPQSDYWLIAKDEYIGRVTIRHKLTDKTRKRGGHIGYYIRPSKRHFGFGTLLLKLGLDKAKKLGLNKVLLTVEKDNLSSIRIVEKCGGKREKPVGKKSERRKDVASRLRYWIRL